MGLSRLAEEEEASRIGGIDLDGRGAGGRDAFYRGEIAEQIVAYSNEVGGFFQMEDFADHTSEWVEPISTTYRGMTVWELPPNPQGLAALQMLNILEGFDLKAMGRDSTDFWHLMVEAKKLAYADRARYYADMQFAEVPVEELLSKDYAADRAKLTDRKYVTYSVPLTVTVKPEPPKDQKKEGQP